MYPAIEITLPLDRVCAVQPSRRTALGYAFRSLYPGHQPAPQTVPVRFGPGAESGRPFRWRLVGADHHLVETDSAMDTPIFEELQIIVDFGVGLFNLHGTLSLIEAATPLRLRRRRF